MAKCPAVSLPGARSAQQRTTWYFLLLLPGAFLAPHSCCPGIVPSNNTLALTSCLTLSIQRSLGCVNLSRDVFQFSSIAILKVSFKSIVGYFPHLERLPRGTE